MKNTNYLVLFEKFLNKQTTVEEVNLLIHWLKQESAFDAWADEEWNAVSSNMDSLLQQKLLRQIKEKMPLAKNPTKGKQLYRWFSQVAAVLLLLLLTGTGVWFYAKEKMAMPDMIVAVEKGQKANITLPDGSLVWINSDTKLTYGSNFTAYERIVNLEGEAYFEVVPDKKRPFIVKTNGMSVRALGTSFDVKSYADEQEISAVLMTGKVEVGFLSDHQILLPDQKIVLNKQTGKMTKSSVFDAHNYNNWKDNTLSFDAETFENIARILERHYNTEIVFDSESLKQYRFTGTPGNTSLESILQILSLTSPLVYEVKDSVIILRENMNEKAYYEKALK